MKYMSTTITASIVSILAVVLPLFGVDFSSEELTTIVQAIAILGAAVWTWKERTKLRKVEAGEVSDVTALGMRK